MALISTFHAGPVEGVAAAIRDRPATADQEFPSAQASGLFQPGIDQACRELGELRGQRVRRRKIPPERPSRGDGAEYAPELRDLAELCRKAEREKLDLVYEWSL
ncbi:MAG TPA: hypothetical protein VLS93_12395 [Anaeromyxobacteraceae bacterium]|nr:hypothetical protein [Anaeromyxobacteraceae bacterium]